MNPDAALPTRHLEDDAALIQAQPWQTTAVTLQSPALEVVTDLSRVKAATTTRSATLRQAEQQMIHLGVRMLFVVDEMPGVGGLVTSTDLSGVRAMQIVNQRGVHFDELVVGDVMTPLAALHAVDFADLKSATVSNLVATLKQHGRNHLLAIESVVGGGSRVRGVISRSQVERQLGQVIEMVEVADSFAEIGRMIG
jgi:CBS domain containing-hemolysin-like protein